VSAPRVVCPRRRHSGPPPAGSNRGAAPVQLSKHCRLRAPRASGSPTSQPRRLLRRMRGSFHFRAQRRTIEGLSQPRVPAPEIPPHRPDPQEATADHRPERQALTGRGRQHEGESGEQAERNHQPQPHSHAKSDVAGGEMDQQRERHAHQDIEGEVEHDVPQDRLGHEGARAGVDIAVEKDPPQRVGGLQRMAGRRVEHEIPERHDHSADQSGGDTFTKRGVLPRVHTDPWGAGGPAITGRYR
jgi:hypothetical protein